MIHSAQISGFKSCRHVELPSLKRVNLFVGSNGSGKTSILQALFLLCVDSDPGKAVSTLPIEEDDANAQVVSAALPWLFSDNLSRQLKISGEFSDSPAKSSSIELTERKVRVEWEKLTRSRLSKSEPSPIASGTTSGDIFGATSDAQKSDEFRSIAQIRAHSTDVVQLTSWHGNRQRAGTMYLTVSGDAVVDVGREPPQIKATLQYSAPSRFPGKDIPKRWDVAESFGIGEAVVSTLRAIDPRITGIKIGVSPAGSPVIRIRHATLGECPLRVLGSGAVELLRFALAQVTEDSMESPHIFFDEFDSSLHVSVLPAVTDMCKQLVDSGRQLFLSTHRSDTVEAFVHAAASSDLDICLYQLRQVDNSAAVTYYDKDSLLRSWLDLQIDLRASS